MKLSNPILSNRPSVSDKSSSAEPLFLEPQSVAPITGQDDITTSSGFSSRQPVATANNSVDSVVMNPHSKPLGSSCHYWKTHLKGLIKKQSYLSENNDNYILTRSNRLLIQGHIKLVQECAPGAAYREDLFARICQLGDEMLAVADPELLSMTLTQVQGEGWERLSLQEYADQLQANYCEDSSKRVIAFLQ
ncbi:hypothetical protein MIB92_04275 [Aestuariirhabdus sp. Z084]|uniref:hypothetical protein n=1 Tax=Aestuariirhabdus haliotis TaxID=2918751 RepID=UPI00201B3C11|nr:hypothetical protein [Aestuariirhabdus haliotis]MCL6414856.1 hypothetical protein [Aestuariirhabdus haliotis]MCL6418788.1 hypothetical protein [Aestuariirhabdus haliotis]